jgi:penicillin-binding protein 1A
LATETAICGRMTGPLIAGEPLVPPTPARQARPAARPDPKQPPNKAGAKPGPKRRRNPIVRFLSLLFGLIFGCIALVAVLGGAVAWVAYQRFSQNLPDLDRVQQYQPPVMSRVYAGDARLMSELATERRIFVPVSAIPSIVQQAFISAEDQSFWHHHGVDPLAIVRAATFDLTHMGQGRRPIGASTITQQVAKTMLLDGEVSIARKAREAILAMRIEDTLPKARILELYLNEIYLGLSAYGVAAAGQTYFNKSLDELNVAEAAFLAALPKAPNNYNPFKYPEAARTRRDWVIDRMAEDHAITTEQAAAAKASPIAPSEFRRPPPVPSSDWFAEEVRRQLVAQFGADRATQGGLEVRTSLDPALQIAAENTLREGLMGYDRKYGGFRGPMTHLESTALDREWATLLAAVTRPPGMLPAWKLAVVLTAGDGDAKLGWLEPAASAGTMALPRTAALAFADMAWARPVKDGKIGAAPRRTGDVLRSGDVVMAELVALTTNTTPAPSIPGPRPLASPAPHFVLRQIPLVQGALVSMEPTTGRVLAMVGGWSSEQSQFNRVTQAQRQPGSSFKPIVYLTALEHGISPSQVFLDAPIVIDTGAGRWRPSNFENTFGGPTPLRVALEHSMNLVTVRVARQVGMDAVAATAAAFHMNETMPHVLPAALGAVETTIMHEAQAYASIAAGGREVIPTLIDSVQDRTGAIISRAIPAECGGCADPAAPPRITDPRKQIADPRSDFQLIMMMQGVVQRGTGYAAGKGLNRAIAGKTGTSQDFIDVWFSGFTPDLETTIWIGFDTPTPLGNNVTGGGLVAPIWHDYMAIALKDRPVLNFPVPPGITIANWGGAIDGFKQGQTPGGSNSAIGGPDPLPTTAGGNATGGGGPVTAPVHGGVDSHLGGLY